MIILLLSVINLLLVARFLITLGIRYGTREQIPAKPPAADDPAPMMSVIVPARNEEENIGDCVASLLDQTYPDDRYEVIVVDDHSEDRTGAIVDALAESSSLLKRIPAPPLQKGWTGKNNACAAGAAQARGDWLCFIDADTISRPHFLMAAVRFAIEKSADLLSFNPFQRMVSLSERLFLPGIFTAIAAGLDFRRVNRPGTPDVLANGQIMLFNRAAYDALGGHGAVSSAILEDMAFARLVKQSGRRLYWAFGDHLMSTRMYRSLTAIWYGFSKNMGDIAALANGTGAVLAGLRSIAIGVLPWIAFGFSLAACLAAPSPTHAWAFGMSILALANMLILFAFVLHALKVPLFYIVGMPLGFTLHGVLIYRNLWNKKQGNLVWKGRKVS